MPNVISYPDVLPVKTGRRRSDLSFSEKAKAEVNDATTAYRNRLMGMSAAIAAPFDGVSELHVVAAIDILEERARKRRRIPRRLLGIIGGIVVGGGLAPVVDYLNRGAQSHFLFSAQHLLLLLTGVVLILLGEIE